MVILSYMKILMNWVFVHIVYVLILLSKWIHEHFVYLELHQLLPLSLSLQIVC